MSSIDNQLSEDVSKVINAKRVIYERILQKLEKEAGKDMVGGSTEGSFTNNFTNEIKIIGTIEMPQVSDLEKVEFRLAKMAFPKVMSLDQAYEYSQLMLKTPNSASKKV